MSDLYLTDILLQEDCPTEGYPWSLPAVRYLRARGRLEFRTPVTFFVGENGVGKSTLVEAIAVTLGFNPEGGSRNYNFSTRESHSELYRYFTARRSAFASGKRSRDGYFLRAESLYNVASYLEELDRIPAAAPPVMSSYGGVSLHEQSHGESFLSLMENRFGGNGIYILDEPEAALSPARQMRLLVLMHELVQKNSQFIISTHSPILMAYPGATVYELSEEGICEKDYRETEHYRLTRRFLEDPDRMFRYLFAD